MIAQLLKVLTMQAELKPQKESPGLRVWVLSPSHTQASSPSAHIYSALPIRRQGSRISPRV